MNDVEGWVHWRRSRRTVFANGPVPKSRVRSCTSFSSLGVASPYAPIIEHCIRISSGNMFTCRIFLVLFRVTFFHRAHTVHDTIGSSHTFAGLEAMCSSDDRTLQCQVEHFRCCKLQILDNILKPLEDRRAEFDDLALVKLRQIQSMKLKRSSAMRLPYAYPLSHFPPNTWSTERILSCQFVQRTVLHLCLSMVKIERCLERSQRVIGFLTLI